MNEVVMYMPDFSKSRLNSSIILFYLNSLDRIYDFIAKDSEQSGAGKDSLEIEKNRKKRHISPSHKGV